MEALEAMSSSIACVPSDAYLFEVPLWFEGVANLWRVVVTTAVLVSPTEMLTEGCTGKPP